MRKLLFPALAMTFLLLSGVAAASAMAKPMDPAPVQFAVDGTFSSGPGVTGVPFRGAVTVTSFAEQDDQLAVQGTLAGTDVAFAPLAITVIATATASGDAGSGCTVQVSTTATFVQESFIISLNGADFTLGESTDPGSARELCRVAAKDASDQGALARALNKIIRN